MTKNEFLEMVRIYGYSKWVRGMHPKTVEDYRKFDPTLAALFDENNRISDKIRDYCRSRLENNK